MKRIFVPTRCGSDWQPLLAKPERHWKRGKSAMTLAASWESSHPRMPQEIVDVCAPLGVEPEYFAAMPEWEVALPGGTTASQTDLLVLGKSAKGLVVIAIEGKVDEPLGPTLGEKRQGASAGQLERLTFLHEVLGLAAPAPDALRYQLFHRTASAVLVARELGAHLAVMLVHSFSPTGMWHEDYAAFAHHFGASGERDVLATLPSRSAPSLAVGWVSGDRRFLEQELPAAG